MKNRYKNSSYKEKTVVETKTLKCLECGSTRNTLKKIKKFNSKGVLIVDYICENCFKSYFERIEGRGPKTDKSAN